MKTRAGMIMLVFLTGMILGAAEPALLYGAESGGGNVWDKFVDPKPYPGVQLEGPLSIYYDITGEDPNCGGIEGNYDIVATMYYTVRLNKDKAAYKKNVQFYTFHGKYEGVCLLTGTDTQGGAIKDFLGNVVIPGIFLDFKSWKLKSIDNVGFDEQSFVADIEIAVKENPKPRR